MFKVLLNLFPRTFLLRFSKIAQIILPIVLRGNRFTDPITGQSYRKFLPYGYSFEGQRENALAPGSLSLERHRLLWLWLSRETDFFSKPAKMLHVAPEQCFLPLFKKQTNLDYITADIESPLADVKMDLHAIPFDDNSFDVIFCNHVLEHVTDDSQCMRELYRVLKPGGWAVLQSPMDIARETTYEDASITDPKEREKHFWQYDHVRLYGRDYKTRLETAGFTVDVIDYANRLNDGEAERFRVKVRNGDDDLYIGRKN